MNWDNCDDPKKRLDHRRHGAGVDQQLRRDVFLILQRQPLANRAGHTRQTDREQIGEQFADRAGAAIAKVIDIVGETFFVAQVDQVLGDRDEILLVEHRLVERNRPAPGAG